MQSFESQLKTCGSLEIHVREFPQVRGTVLGGPNIKDYSILGSILGFPYLGKVPSVGMRKLSCDCSKMGLWKGSCSSIL